VLYYAINQSICFTKRCHIQCKGTPKSVIENKIFLEAIAKLPTCKHPHCGFKTLITANINLSR
jgi:hypothetical protein